MYKTGPEALVRALANLLNPRYPEMVRLQAAVTILDLAKDKNVSDD
jgi:hypothetical protein